MAARVIFIVAALCLAGVSSAAKPNVAKPNAAKPNAAKANDYCNICKVNPLPQGLPANSSVVLNGLLANEGKTPPPKLVTNEWFRICNCLCHLTTRKETPNQINQRLMQFLTTFKSIKTLYQLENAVLKFQLGPQCSLSAMFPKKKPTTPAPVMSRRVHGAKHDNQWEKPFSPSHIPLHAQSQKRRVHGDPNPFNPPNQKQHGKKGNGWAKPFASPHHPSIRSSPQEKKVHGNTKPFNLLNHQGSKGNGWAKPFLSQHHPSQHEPAKYKKIHGNTKPFNPPNKQQRMLDQVRKVNGWTKPFPSPHNPSLLPSQQQKKVHGNTKPFNPQNKQQRIFGQSGKVNGWTKPFPSPIHPGAKMNLYPKPLHPPTLLTKQVHGNTEPFHPNQQNQDIKFGDQKINRGKTLNGPNGPNSPIPPQYQAPQFTIKHGDKAPISGSVANGWPMYPGPARRQNSQLPSNMSWEEILAWLSGGGGGAAKPKTTKPPKKKRTTTPKPITTDVDYHNYPDYPQLPENSGSDGGSEQAPPMEVTFSPLPPVTDGPGAPDIVTDAPEIIIDAPEIITDAPEVSTEAFEDLTVAPEDPADAPEDPADAPEDPADAPEDAADAPEDPTKAPEDPTKAPEDPTEAPGGPTDTPENPTDAPGDPEMNPPVEEPSPNPATPSNGTAAQDPVAEDPKHTSFSVLILQWYTDVVKALADYNASVLAMLQTKLDEDC